MSRTIRRKNEMWERYWFVDAWYNEFEHETRAINIDYTKEYTKRKTEYHSDKYAFHAPKDFRQSLNREFRSRNKAILNYSVHNYQDPVFIPFIKNADWNYY